MICGLSTQYLLSNIRNSGDRNRVGKPLYFWFSLIFVGRWFSVLARQSVARVEVVVICPNYKLPHLNHTNYPDWLESTFLVKLSHRSRVRRELQFSWSSIQMLTVQRTNKMYFSWYLAHHLKADWVQNLLEQFGKLRFDWEDGGQVSRLWPGYLQLMGLVNW